LQPIAYEFGIRLISKPRIINKPYSGRDFLSRLKLDLLCPSLRGKLGSYARIAGTVATPGPIRAEFRYQRS